MTKSFIAAFLFSSLIAHAQNKHTNNPLLTLVQSFSKTSAVSGREEEAQKFVEQLLEQQHLKKDKLGNLVLSIGSGSPKRLFTTALDEPGYVISEIQEDGYLRISPLGYASGTMFHQFLQGNEIKINTQHDIAYGVCAVPSTHYEGLRQFPERAKNVYQWQEGFIDAGFTSSKEVMARGIQLLDPVTAHKKPVIIDNAYIAAPSMKSKAAVMALASVAKSLLESKFPGTITIAFTTLELINGKGLEDVIQQYGPFDEIVRFNRYLNGPITEGAGILADKKIPEISAPIKISTAVGLLKPSLNLISTSVYEIGLPSNYTSTPVEMVPTNSIEELIRVWLHIAENKTWNISVANYTEPEKSNSVFKSFQPEEVQVSKLIAPYGVSMAEAPVRNYILSALPKWAKPHTDEKGNIIVTFGNGSQHLAFVAHMDEVGYVVDTIREDGKIILKQRGGFFNSIWEGHAAIIHGAQNDIPALFEPRANYLNATMKMNGTSSPVVYAGFKNKEEAKGAGITEGVTTVTMPKKMIRLSENRATARGFDDRAGCAALLLALQHINPGTLPFKITFIWSVEEETGLTGATFAAKELQDVSTVYPIDTFVSSDEPVDSKIFGNCPLGNGAVIRVLESVNFVRRKDLAYMQTLALKNNIKVQYGMTAGGTDGQEFLRYDIPSIPLSWPGRYSHSPIEIMDFRDLDNLVKLINAIMVDKGRMYEK